ncbi:hypothetical protein [Ruegeria atlantica]|uniref:Uncharacterized protein n=1 Tax=Ruegeria atlantica TaxID=81569 RepID=A0A0P1E633_9RHOB|nr:hypothetical protein [Ruegeria atlantica]CUH43425.1 hypothetical protein RUM4293_02320 [Ruegeria atlantica]
MGVVVTICLFFLCALSIGLSTIWVWLSVLIGKREPTFVRSIFLLASAFSITAILCFGDPIGDPFSHLLTLFLWPLVWFFALPPILAANLNYFFVIALAVLTGTLVLALMTTRITRVLVFFAGSVLAVLVPAAVENSIVMAQMTSKAEASGLVIVDQSSFFRSVSEGFSDFKNPHGYACDADDWPSLWSYKQRDWVPLPTNTRFGGNNPELIKIHCQQSRRYPVDSSLGKLGPSFRFIRRASLHFKLAAQRSLLHV